MLAGLPRTHVPSSSQQMVLRPRQSCRMPGAPRSLGLHGPQGAASWWGKRRPSVSVGCAPRPKWSFLRSLAAVTTGPSPASKGERNVRGPVPEGGISSVPGAQLSHPHRVSRARSRLGVGGVSRVCPLACANASRPCATRSSCHCSPSQLHSLFLGLGDAFLGFLWSARRRLLRGPCQPCASPAPSCTLSPTRGRHYPPHALSGQKRLWSKDPVSPRLLSAASNASQPERAKDVRGREEPRVHPGTRDKQA